MGWTDALRAGKTAFLEGRDSDSAACLELTVGNEAADCDSLVCALAVAALRARQSPASHAVALAGCARADVRLRGDVTWLLARHGLEEAALLVCADEGPAAAASARLAAGAAVHTTLVDHNKLCGGLEGALGGSVCEVLDHHEDERAAYTAALPAERLTLVPVGSCATLVTERLAREAPALLSPQAEGGALPELLLAAVLLDTANLTGASGRCTERDRAAAQLLREALGLDAAGASELFAALHRERVAGGASLGVPEMLRKDYKEWVMGSSGYLVGVSSVTAPLSALVECAGLQEALSGWAAARGADVLVVMTASGEGDAFRRELAVFEPAGSRIAAAGLLPRLVRLCPAAALLLAFTHASVPAQLEALKGREELRLEASPAAAGWPTPAAAFNQANTRASRKMVQPALVEIFQSI